MGLRTPDIPGTSASDNCKCGKPASSTIEGLIEVMGRIVKIKIRACSEHAGLIGERYSLKKEENDSSKGSI